ncbi:MAG: response regulator [Verrucomicrobia bacterium]|nr:response regulator [Verrucomicrobiota bacterium]MDA1087458.1 response regulator [Verrucomicrobiota bacterium]
MKILAIDDDLSVLDTIERMLADTDHVVDCFQSACAAVDAAKAGDYDFMLVDYKMPERDGIWFMKNASVPPKTKSLLVTAYANQDIIQEMFRLGISGYIIKPFDRDELLRHLDYHSSSDDQ